MSYESEGYTYLIRQSLAEAAQRYTVCARMRALPADDVSVIRSVRATYRAAHAIVAEAVAMVGVMEYNGFDTPDGATAAANAFSDAYSEYELAMWDGWMCGDDTSDDIEEAETELEAAAFLFASVFAGEDEDC